MEQRSANICRMTINERKFIEKALLSELRFDGRRPFAYRQLAIKFGSEEGSSEVQLGQTHVMPFVTSQLVQPFRDWPNEGTRSIFTEFSPIADPSFEPGRPGEYAVELGCMVDRGLRESRAADTESLCVLAGRLVWAIRFDLHILDNGGNLVDAANIAALAALMTFRRPECTPEGDNGQEVTVHPPEGQDQGPRVLYCLILARRALLQGHMKCPIVLGLLRLFLNLGNPPANSLPPLCIITFQARAHSCQNLFTRLCIRIRFQIMKRVGQWMKLIVSCWLLSTNVLPCGARALQVSISSSTTLLLNFRKWRLHRTPV